MMSAGVRSPPWTNACSTRPGNGSPVPGLFFLALDSGHAAARREANVALRTAGFIRSQTHGGQAAPPPESAAAPGRWPRAGQREGDCPSGQAMPGTAPCSSPCVPARLRTQARGILSVRWRTERIPANPPGNRSAMCATRQMARRNPPTMRCAPQYLLRHSKEVIERSTT